MNFPKALFGIVGYVVMAGLGTASAWPPPPPPADYNEIQKEVFKKVNERFGIHSGHVVEVNRDGVIYEFRTNLMDIGLTAPDPVERAYQFFDLHKDLFRIPDPRQELVATDTVYQENGSGSIIFEQYVEGVKVYQVRCGVYFSRDDTGVHLNRFHSDAFLGLLPDAHEINPVPTIDSLEAGCIAQSDPAHGKKVTYVSYHGLWIANDYWYGLRPFPDKRTHLVWHLTVNGGEAYWGSVEYFIDAHTGEILYVGQADKVCPGR